MVVLTRSVQQEVVNLLQLERTNSGIMQIPNALLSIAIYHQFETFYLPRTAL